MVSLLLIKSPLVKMSDEYNTMETLLVGDEVVGFLVGFLDGDLVGLLGFRDGFLEGDLLGLLGFLVGERDGDVLGLLGFCDGFLDGLRVGNVVIVGF
jgi:hypothetical protein